MMRDQLIYCVFLFYAITQMAHSAPIGKSSRFEELWQMMNNSNAPAAERVAAEAALSEAVPATLLSLAFREVYRRPVGPFVDEGDIAGALQITPHIGGQEAAEELGWPPYIDIIHSRMRLWRHLVANAQPEESRKRIITNLFDNYETDYELYLLFEASIWNHTPGLEQKLWEIFADREREPSVRVAAASTLSRVTHLYSKVSFRQFRQRTMEYLWAERGSDVATSLGGLFGGPRFEHPYLNVLKLDWYDRERSSETRRSRNTWKELADRIDQSFDNVTGLYETIHGSVSDKRLAVVRQRRVLREEARATGDDSKLHAFEVEVAERRQQELETRIERIDAWIAANRERLEQEAVDYAREQQRRRELHQGNDK